jgi:hypothetical protein
VILQAVLAPIRLLCNARIGLKRSSLNTPVSPTPVSNRNSVVPPALAAALPNVGFDRQDAGGILGGNDMRVFAASRG